MYKIAVLGDYDSIYGFASLGLATFPVTEEEEASRLLRKLAADDYAVIYITEALAALIPDTVAAYEGAMTPAVIPIPGVSGNTGSGMAMVRRSVEKAVGSDIIFKED